MPFECRKDGMVWGPHHASVTLRAGDEVPAPVRQNLINSGRVAKVEKIAGKTWAEQPEEARKAWAESQGLSFLVDVHTGERTRVKAYPGQLVTDEVEAMAPVQPEPLEAVGVASASDDEAPPPPPEKRRGRPKKKRD